MPIAKRNNDEDRLVRVVVVDDHRFMRELITARLCGDARAYDVVGEGEDAASGISACEKHKPDVLILDINLPDQSGVDAVPRIKRVSPATRILLCTAYVSEDCATKARLSGADGFVEKTNTWDDFITAVEQVSFGNTYFVAAGRSSSDAPESLKVAVQGLTGREREILKLIADSDSSKEIASRLGISVATVEKHRANLMAKLHVRNVAGLVSFAFHSGVISPSPRWR